MEENINKIISKFTNVLSKINTGEFLNKIKEAKDINECLEVSKKFCELITNVKGQMLFDIPEELSSLIQKDKLINETNNSMIINNNTEKNNNISDNNIKNILSQFKFKLFNLNSNISELNINLNNINGNMKKHKYSLATKRLENLFKLKDKMNNNITFLDGIRNNLNNNINNLNSKSSNDNNTNNSKKKVIQLAKTPSPFRIKKKDNQNLSKIKLINKSPTHKKNSSTNKLLNMNIKAYNTIENKRKNSFSKNLSLNISRNKTKK